MQPPKATVRDVTRDLEAEHGALDAVLVGVDAAAWERPTPSPRWAVRDQIGHLAYFDRSAALAINDPAGFAEHRSELMAAAAATFDGSGDGEDADAVTLGAYRAMAPDALLESWRNARAELIAAAETLGDGDRVEWYGPSMGAKSFLTARLMETWAHGRDVTDALGTSMTPTDRLIHIAQLGVITRGWSYAVRGEEVPAAEVHVALDAPGGGVWTWNDPEAGDRITGPAEDFCLVVTQRRHVADTALEVVGAAAADWMAKAQAFAGGATSGPSPRD
jgi:uncharacterized protein (TIGR03084 family)